MTKAAQGANLKGKVVVSELLLVLKYHVFGFMLLTH